MERIGIDVGGVLIEPKGGPRSDTQFLGSRLEDAVRTPPAPGAFDVVAALSARAEVWVVSKCGPSVQKKTLAWMAHHDFHGRTGVPPDRVRFCLERRDKAVHAAALGLVAFVDDRADVLGYLDGIVPLRVWFGVTEAPPGLTPAPDWPAVGRVLGNAR